MARLRVDRWEKEVETQSDQCLLSSGSLRTSKGKRSIVSEERLVSLMADAMRAKFLAACSRSIFLELGRPLKTSSSTSIRKGHLVNVTSSSSKCCRFWKDSSTKSG